jgi:hypothetical protein
LRRSRTARTLLRIRITAEVDGVRSDYTITYGRYGRNNVAVGLAYASADAPGGREADAERFVAVIKALTGVKPRIRRMKNGIGNDGVLRETSRGLQALRRACRRHRRVAGGDGIGPRFLMPAPKGPQVPREASLNCRLSACGYTHRGYKSGSHDAAEVAWELRAVTPTYT